MIYQGIFYAVAAYLFGSIPFGKLIARKVASIDITTRGSRNIGATNVARELGIKWGLLTLFLDILKGFVPVFLVSNYASPALGIYHCIGVSVVCLAALLGHQFSIFLRFRGGKGVGTAAGVYLAISPLSCLIALLLFLLIVYKWDYISLGSMIAACAMPFLLVAFGESPSAVISSIIVAALICFKHTENIQRLLRGAEMKWSERKSQDNRSRSLPNSSSE